MHSCARWLNPIPSVVVVVVYSQRWRCIYTAQPKLNVWIGEKKQQQWTSVCVCVHAVFIYTSEHTWLSSRLSLDCIVLWEYWFFLSRSWPYHQCAKVISLSLYVPIHHIFMCCVVLCRMWMCKVKTLCVVYVYCVCTYLFPIGNCLFGFLVYWIHTKTHTHSQCNKLTHLDGQYLCEHQFLFPHSMQRRSLTLTQIKLLME